MREPMKGFLALAIWFGVGIVVLPPLAWIAWHVACALGEFAIWWVEWWVY